MPTIEIASINAPELGLNQADFAVAIIEENKLESHRGLFYDLLRQQKGVLVHLGNPEFKYKNGGGFFAGLLIDLSDDLNEEIVIPESNLNDIDSGANQQFTFKFLSEYRLEIDKLLRIALEKSPVKKVCFLTDYQFGPEKESIEIIYTIKGFWELHDGEGLALNTLYEIYGT